MLPDSMNLEHRLLAHARHQIVAHSPPSYPTLSVVVASRNRPRLLGACLESVRGCVCAPHEIVVVDSASHDPEATARVARQFNAAFIRTEIPGSAHARNLGIVAARGDIVAFSDDDVIVDSGWVSALMETFADPSVDASVGPVFILGTKPAVAMAVGAAIEPSTDETRFSNADPDWFDRLALGSIGFGANLAVRRSAFDRYGLFRNCLGAGAPIPGDENYFLLCLVARGGLVVNDPRARVTHPPQSPDRLRELRRAALAYLIYLSSTQPYLIPKILKRVAGRFSPGLRKGVAHGAYPNTWPLADLAQIVAAAPGMLFAAWRIERRLGKPISVARQS